MKTKQEGYYPIPGFMDRYFRFTYGSIAMLEEQFGVSSIFEIDENKMGNKQLLLMIQAGLRHENATFDDADELMSKFGREGKLDELLTALFEALLYGLGGEKAVEEGKKAMGPNLLDPNQPPKKNSHHHKKNGRGGRNRNGSHGN